MDMGEFTRKYFLVRASIFFLEQAFSHIRSAIHIEISGVTFVTNVKLAAVQAGIENIPESNIFHEVSVWFAEIIDKNPEFATNIDAYRDPNSISVFNRKLRTDNRQPKTWTTPIKNS